MGASAAPQADRQAKTDKKSDILEQRPKLLSDGADLPQEIILTRGGPLYQ